MDTGKNIRGTAAVMAMIALLAGGVIGYMVGMNSEGNKANIGTSQSTDPKIDTAAANLRVLLNNLEQEHVNLAAAATRAGFDGDASFTAAAGQLGKNTEAISAAVGSVYGDEAGAQFKEIWESHIGFFVDYTVAAKKGDTKGMQQAVDNLGGYVEEISIFFSNANKNLPKDAVKMLVSEHVNLLKAAVDNHGAGKYAESYAKEYEAVEQIHGIADAIAGAIVKQKPTSFTN
jgi:hypothetical protein